MGAGTGPLYNNSADLFQVVIAFEPPFVVPDGFPATTTSDFNVYCHFKEAMTLLVDGLWRAGGCPPLANEVRYEPVGTAEAGYSVAHMTVIVRGPLIGENPRAFNRAFNRLLWGIRYRGRGRPSGVTLSLRKEGSNVLPDWADEDT